MKSTLRNMVVVLFTITAVSAFLVGVVNNVTKDTIAKTNAENKLKALTEVLPAFEGEVCSRYYRYRGCADRRHARHALGRHDGRLCRRDSQPR